MDDPALNYDLDEKKGCQKTVPSFDSQSNSFSAQIYYSESRGFDKTKHYGIFKGKPKNHQSFVVIPSLSKPRWILDTNFIKSSSTLNPSTYKARFALYIFKKLWSMGLQRIIFPARIHIFSSNKSVPLINRLVKKKEYIGCFYIGSIGPLQKYTIEIAQKNNCTGYIKIAPTIAAKVQIESEVKALAFMCSKNIENIELPMHSETFLLGKDNGYAAFRQSPVSAREVPTGMRPEIMSFLRNVARRTGHSKQDEVKLYFDAIRVKLLNLDCLFKSLLNLESVEISKSLDDLDTSEEALLVAFSHGDFTRWNTRICDGSLSVFDWEEGGFRPVSHDFFHFIFSEHVLVSQKTDFREFYQTSKSYFASLWDDSFDSKPRFELYLYLYFLWLSIYYLDLISTDDSEVFMRDKSNMKVISFLRNAAKYFSRKYLLSLTQGN